MSGEPAPKKQGALKQPWQPGQSGNPNGRPKGSRNKLAEVFLEELHADFVQHGKQAIEKTRTEKPDVYMRVIAAVLPKELHIKESPFDGVTDEDLADALAAVRALRSAREGDSQRTEH